MITQTVEYALRAIVLSRGSEWWDARTTEQIAEVTRVPKAYLSKGAGESGPGGLGAIATWPSRGVFLAEGSRETGDTGDHQRPSTR